MTVLPTSEGTGEVRSGDSRSLPASAPKLVTTCHCAAAFTRPRPRTSNRHLPPADRRTTASGLFTILGFHQFLPSQELVSLLTGQLCRLEPALCLNILTAICGYNPDNLDSNRLPLYLKYTPAGQ